jgi:hypothetical protein
MPQTEPNIKTCDCKKHAPLPKRMLRRTFFAAAVAGIFSPQASYAQWTTNDSPFSVQNNPFNTYNSPFSVQNSPFNTQNNPFGVGNNGIYDNNGNRMGYGVYRPDGGINLFDNQGNRFGYRPGR